MRYIAINPDNIEYLLADTLEELNRAVAGYWDIEDLEGIDIYIIGDKPLRAKATFKLEPTE